MSIFFVYDHSFSRTFTAPKHRKNTRRDSKSFLYFGGENITTPQN